MIYRVGLKFSLLLAFIISIVLGNYLDKTSFLICNIFDPIGKIYLNLLKLMMVPTVIISLLFGITKLDLIQKVIKLTSKAFLLFATTNAFSSIIGLVIAVICNLGLADATNKGAENIPKGLPSLSDVLISIIPSNIIKSLSENNMQQIALSSIVLALIMLSIKDKLPILNSVIYEIDNIVNEINKYVIKLLPIGIICLVSPAISRGGNFNYTELFKFVILFYITTIAFMLLVYPLLIKLFTNLLVFDFIKGILPAQIVAYSTASSNATISTSLSCLIDNLKLNKGISNYIISLGANIGKNGTTMYQAMAIVFIANTYRFNISYTYSFYIIILITILSFGTPGIPNAGFIMLALIINTLGLPLEGIALIASIEILVDMLRTVPNVTISTICAAIASNEVCVEEGGRDIVHFSTNAN